MIKKIFSIVVKILVGIFVFYLLVSWIAIPLLAPRIISSQVTKALRHDVKLRSISFNPFLWRLSLGGLSILDAQHKRMAGFGQLTVDVSFLKLLVKQYRLERIELNGLEVNAALLPNGKINLLDLIPPTSTTIPPVEPAATHSSSKPSNQPLPLVIIETFDLHKGVIRFTDKSVTPEFVTVLDNIECHGVDLSTDPARQAKTIVSARLNEKGLIKNEATVKPFAQPLELETSFTLNSYAMQVLTPYVGKYTGRSVKDGKLDFKMDYRIAGNKLTASHKILIQRFDFGDKVDSKDALGLPFGLALALLEDPQGNIDISLPVNGDMSDPEFHYIHLIGQVARNFFLKLVTKPFSILASAVGIGGSSGAEQDMGNIHFAPGAATFSDEEKAKLIAIVQGLKDRPRVSLEVKGSYDPNIDWKAIKAQVFDKDYEALREESKRPELEVYKQLYQRRFGIKELWVLARQFRLPNGTYETALFTAELKRQLVDDGSADQLALATLGQARAQTIYDFLKDHGFDPKRLSMGVVHQVEGTTQNVPLELVLNVFDGSTQGVSASELPVIK